MTFSAAILWVAGVAAVAGPILTFFWVRARLRSGKPWLGWIAAGVVALAWAFGVWSAFVEPERFVVRNVTVESPLWRGEPIRLGLISDTHVGGPHMSPARMARIVQRMNDQHPDLVLLLGDYAGRGEDEDGQSDPGRGEVIAGIAALSGLKAPLGVAGVFGNHDVVFGPDEIRQALEAAHVRVLMNDAERIERPGGAFWLAGVADAMQTPRPAPMRTYLSVDRSEPSILMAHEPGSFGRFPRLRFALMTAGHTHCGQINVPGLRRLATSLMSSWDRKYLCGLYRNGDQALYVTGGLGTSNLPLRFAAPPEIVILTLKAAPLASDAPAQ